MVDEIESGNLRVLVVFGGNPLSAFPDASRTRRAFERLDALIVLDVIEKYVVDRGEYRRGTQKPISSGFAFIVVVGRRSLAIPCGEFCGVIRRDS
jgi:hypothetical protein